MSKHITCDLCGAEMTETEFKWFKHGGRITYAEPGRPRSTPGTTFDLCDECCEKFTRFVDDGGHRYGE